MPGVPPRMAAACRPVSRPSPAASATASRTDGSPMNRASRPIAFEPPPTQARARSGSRPSASAELCRRLVADPPLEVAHDRRVRVRAHRRAQHVVGGLDVRHPVAHRLVDRVLQGGRPGGDAADVGAEGAHPEDVRTLALDVLGAHVHDARQLEQRARGGRRHAVLTGTGLGDDPGLAEAPRQERLAERVVDLVGAGVGEVLALEVQPTASARGGRPGASPRRGPRRRGGRRGRSAWDARRTARAGPRSSAQNTGSWRSASYAVSSSTRAAISVSGT